VLFQFRNDLSWGDGRRAGKARRRFLPGRLCSNWLDSVHGNQ
jgi:hypothetical protein